jgi:hypothetical protein
LHMWSFQASMNAEQYNNTLKAKSVCNVFRFLNQFATFFLCLPRSLRLSMETRLISIIGFNGVPTEKSRDTYRRFRN